MSDKKSSSFADEANERNTKFEERQQKRDAENQERQQAREQEERARADFREMKEGIDTIKADNEKTLPSEGLFDQMTAAGVTHLEGKAKWGDVEKGLNAHIDRVREAEKQEATQNGGSQKQENTQKQEEEQTQSM